MTLVQNAPHTITGHTSLVGLLGWPVGHTISPPMHNAAFAALQMDWCYVPFAVPPEQLATAVAGARALGLRGLNATVPHKQALLDLVDELTPEAAAIGAVNTLLFGDRITGHNTDGIGFINALQETGTTPCGRHALLLGAGGAARAVGYALLREGASLTILNRTASRADSLANDLATVLPGSSVDAAPLDADTVARYAQLADLIVNCTLVGMSPHDQQCPWPAGVAYPAGIPLFDLIYAPPETRLMALARSATRRMSERPYLRAPGRSACPGRGRVHGGTSRSHQFS
ncbi:MAG: shikimate dehydrogenase [Chloroflexi bacterium]|nr:shikimate dehydrogenase [Chloroflexota bacterium]